MIRDKAVLSRFLASLLSSAVVFTSLSLPDIARASAQPPTISQFAQRLNLSEELGFITETYKADAAQRVVILQDLHLHHPTQQRIRRILDHLYAKNLVSGPVAIEGMQGDYDTTVLASFPAGKTKEKLVDYFMQKGELSGDEAFAILRGEGHRLFGVDDGNYYELNRELYKNTLSNRKALETHLSRIQTHLRILKKEHFTRALRRLDKNEAYDVASEEELVAQKYQAAKSIRDKKEATLVRNIIEIDHSLYFLTKLLRQETTLEEVRYLAQRLPQFVQLTQRLLKMESASFLNQGELEEVLKSGIDFYAVALMRNKPLAENTLALLRTPARLQAGTSHGAPLSTVLVAGGFHTAGITQEFKKAGVGFVVITPNVEEITNGYHDLYESRMADRHVTFDEIDHDFKIRPEVASQIRNTLSAPTQTVRVLTFLVKKTGLSHWRYAARVIDQKRPLFSLIRTHPIASENPNRLRPAALLSNNDPRYTTRQTRWHPFIPYTSSLTNLPDTPEARKLRYWLDSMFDPNLNESDPFYEVTKAINSRLTQHEADFHTPIRIVVSADKDLIASKTPIVEVFIEGVEQVLVFNQAWVEEMIELRERFRSDPSASLAIRGLTLEKADHSLTHDFSVPTTDLNLDSDLDKDEARVMGIQHARWDGLRRTPEGAPTPYTIAVVALLAAHPIQSITSGRIYGPSGVFDAAPAGPVARDAYFLRYAKSLPLSEVRAHPIAGGENRSPIQVATTELSPEEELATLREFLLRLQQERSNPGSVVTPKVAAISDQHGTIDKFDALILDAIRSVLPAGSLPADFKLDPDKTLQEQLALHGVLAPDELKGLIYFHNLGDFMDRGPYGVKVFNRSKELVQMGLSDFVIGNHDLWEFMNLQAFHLPWYPGFNFYDYSDDYDTILGTVQQVTEDHREQDKETRGWTWWAEKLAAFTAHHEKRQKDYWNRYDELINGKLLPGSKDRSPGLYAHVAPALKPDTKAQRAWDQLRGWYSQGKIDVYTGTRAVGTVSIKWWQEVLTDLQEAYAAELSGGANESLPAMTNWREAIRLVEKEIIPELKRDLQDHLVAGEWWWRIFEAINSKNYTSPEWWAKDWAFHKDWGTAVLKEINESQPGINVTQANYLDNPTLNEIASFFRDHFTLYVRDIYQNVYVHGFLPVDQNTGEYFFTYKGQEYRGKGSAGHPSVWEGLDRIAEDVRNPNNSMRDLYPAFSLVNEWYADNTTQAKVPNVAAAINRFGPKHLAAVNGPKRSPMAHLPFHEFSKLKDKAGVITGFHTDGFIFTDHGMGTRFGSRGAWVSVGVDGLYLRGFEHDKADGIVSHPRTVKTIEGLEGPTEQVLFHNPGIPREVFLPTVISDVEARIAELESNSRSKVHSPARGFWGSAALPGSAIEEWGTWLLAKIFGYHPKKPVIAAKESYVEVPEVAQKPAAWRTILLAAAFPAIWTTAAIFLGITQWHLLTSFSPVIAFSALGLAAVTTSLMHLPSMPSLGDRILHPKNSEAFEALPSWQRSLIKTMQGGEGIVGLIPAIMGLFGVLILEWFAPSHGITNFLVSLAFLQSAILTVLHWMGLRTPDRLEDANDLYRVRYGLQHRLSALPRHIDVLAQRIIPERDSKTAQISIQSAMGDGITGIMAGHSETREALGDTDARVNAQLKAGFAQNIRTRILAVGEDKPVRDAGEAYEWVQRQLKEGLENMNLLELMNLTIAYEPIWAIGKMGEVRQPASAADAQMMAYAIRRYLRRTYGGRVAESVRILYGGSVKPNTVKGIMAQPDIDGVLVGAASNNLNDFKTIMEAVMQAGPKNGRIPYFGANWKANQMNGSLKGFASVMKKADPERIQIGIIPEMNRIRETRQALLSALHPVRALFARLLGLPLEAPQGSKVRSPSGKGTGKGGSGAVATVSGDKDSLRRVLDNPNTPFDIKLAKPYLDAFGSNLAWYIDRLVKSTAGVRGVVSIDPKDILGGPQLNAAVIFFVAQAYADYIKEHYPQQIEGREIQRAAFVGYDERHFSREYADIFTRVFVANGIKVYRDNNNPADGSDPISTATPISSYMAFHLRLASAIEITASHNPPNQTGVKSQSWTGGVDLDSIADIIAQKANALHEQAQREEGVVHVGALNDPVVAQVHAKQIYYENYWKRIFTKERMRQMEEDLKKTEGKVLLDGLYGVAGPTFRYYLNRMIEDYGLDGTLWMDRILIRNDQADPNMGGLKKPDPSDPNTLALAGDLDVLVKNPSIRVVSVSDMDGDRIGTAIIVPPQDVERARRLGLFVSELEDGHGHKVYSVRFTPNQIFTLQAYGRALEAIRTHMGYPTLTHARNALAAASGIGNGYEFQPGEEAKLQDIRKRLVLITTVPTSMITKTLMDFLGGRIINCCVGFKYLGDQAYELDRAYREETSKHSIILSILEESGGAQIGPVDPDLQYDADNMMSIHRDKDTLTETMELFFHAIRLDAQKESLLDFYSEMAQNLGGLLYYERLDAYLPTQKKAESLDGQDQAEATAIKEQVAARAAELEKPHQGELLLDLFRPVLGDAVTLTASKEVTVDDAVFLLKDDDGRWMNVSPKGWEYTYSNGWRIQTLHIGSEGKEGPAIRLFDAQGKEIVRTAFRKSGTESLVRLYMEIFEPTEGGNPHHLITYFTPLIQHLGLDQYALETGGPNYMQRHIKSIEGKYPKPTGQASDHGVIARMIAFLTVGLGSLIGSDLLAKTSAPFSSSHSTLFLSVALLGVTIVGATALAKKWREIKQRRAAQRQEVKRAHTLAGSLNNRDVSQDMPPATTQPIRRSNRLARLFVSVLPKDKRPAAEVSLREASGLLLQAAA